MILIVRAGLRRIDKPQPPVQSAYVVVVASVHKIA
jgi:hypothetical protein